MTGATERPAGIGRRLPSLSPSAWAPGVATVGLVSSTGVSATSSSSGRLGGRSGVTRSAVRSDPTAVAQLLADPATLRAVSAS